MKIPALSHAKYAQLSPRQQTVVIGLTVLACLLFCIILGKCYQAFHNNQAAYTPITIRQGKQIRIPAHSPLRGQMTIKAVACSSLPHIISLPGVIEADPAHSVNMLPPLTGRLITLNVNLGDVVQQNQVVAEISSPDLAQASADNDKALAILKQATEALTRTKEVTRAGGSAVKDVQQAQSNYIQAQAEAKRTKDRLIATGNNGFSLLTIKAPMDGRITALNYGLGSYITDPTATLMSISDLTTVWVTANVPENLLGSIAINQTVDIFLAAYPQRHLQGKISFLNAILDPDTHRNKTRIVLPNPKGELQPNMYATVKVTVPEPDVISIPISAIFMNDDAVSVYVETSPWIFERRTVRLGSEDGNQVRVLSGLTAGNRIVVNGGIFIND
ncbi:MAG: efflux RND transporter periplasmic adaptor subunit [Legionellales bacterium]